MFLVIEGHFKMNTWPKKDILSNLIEWSDLISWKSRLSAEEFRDLYSGKFEPDERSNRLYERLLQYYKDTSDSMSNKEALKYYKEFKSWCVDNGYSSNAVSRMKMQHKFNGEQGE